MLIDIRATGLQCLIWRLYSRARDTSDTAIISESRIVADIPLPFAPVGDSVDAHKYLE